MNIHSPFITTTVTTTRDALETKKIDVSNVTPTTFTPIKEAPKAAQSFYDRQTKDPEILKLVPTPAQGTHDTSKGFETIELQPLVIEHHQHPKTQAYLDVANFKDKHQFINIFI